LLCITKKVILSGLLFISNNALAQSNYYVEDERTFKGAVMAGTTFTQVDGDNFKGYYKKGITAGGGVYTMLGEDIGMGLEVLYTQKGSKGNLSKGGTIPGLLMKKYSIEMDYAEVPLQVYYFDKHKNHFGGGVSYSQLISAKEKFETDPPQTFTDKDYPFRKMDINLILSSNFHLWKGLYITARFQYSLVPVRKKVPPNFGRQEQFNNTIVFRIMYVI
jgi:hypothetical protein